MSTPTAPPDYGIDAPGVVRNLLLAAAAGLALWGSTALGLWSGRIAVGPVVFVLAPMGFAIGLGCLAMAGWMVWSSKSGKLREREHLLDALALRGDEQVLDVGCGRGLMLVGAARRLAAGGRATGVDLWQAEDLSGNRPEAPLENARREGVADRVEVRTADMRELPFPDGAFDAAVSNAAIHNVYDAAGRARAIQEIARVLRPGGRAVVSDVRHVGEYARAFRAAGVTLERRLDSRLGSALVTLATVGSLRPGAILVRKGGG